MEADFDPSAWPILGSATANATGFGGFVGYNTQWQDHRSRPRSQLHPFPIHVTAPSTPTFVRRSDRFQPDITDYDLDASAHRLDADHRLWLAARARRLGGRQQFPALRLRGFAVGRANYARRQRRWTYGDDAHRPFCRLNVVPCRARRFRDPRCLDLLLSPTATRRGNAVLLYGFSVGGGVDIAADIQYFPPRRIRIHPVRPGRRHHAAIRTARVGAGLKF